MLLYCVLAEFTLAAASWATYFVIIIQQFRWTITESTADSVTRVRLGNIRVLANAIILVNYVITDGVLVHRAGVLCQGFGQSRSKLTALYMRIPQASLSITVGPRCCIQNLLGAFRLTCTGPLASVVATIVLRATATALIMNGRARIDAIEQALKPLQVASLGFTLITNVSAMAPIVILTLRYRKQDTDFLRGVTTAGSGVQVLAVLVESGVIYCIVSIISIPVAFIHLPCGTLGDLFVQAGAQLAGIYVAVVIVVVAVSQGELSGGSEYTSDGTAIISLMVFGHAPGSEDTHWEEQSVSQCSPDKGDQPGENDNVPSHN